MTPKIIEIESRARDGSPARRLLLPLPSLDTAALAGLVSDGGAPVTGDLAGAGRTVARALWDARSAATSAATAGGGQALRQIPDAGAAASSLAADVAGIARAADLPSAVGAGMAALGELVRGTVDGIASDGSRLVEPAAGKLRSGVVRRASGLRPPRRRRRPKGWLLLVAVAIGLAVPLVLLLARRRAERDLAAGRSRDRSTTGPQDGSATIGGTSSLGEPGVPVPTPPPAALASDASGWREGTASQQTRSQEVIPSASAESRSPEAGPES